MLQFIVGMIIGRLLYLIYHDIKDWRINQQVARLLPPLVEAWVRAEENVIRDL